MENEHPLVSIIIPCYNAERYISSAIESALGQTYENCEIIVLDDGSTDSSLNLIKLFDDHIRWISTTNQGGCEARNRGIEISSGEFIKFLDADDILTPWDIEYQIKAARNLDDKSIVVGLGIEGKASMEIMEALSSVSIPCYEPPVYYPAEHWLRNSFLITPPLHRKSILQDFNGFDTRCLRGQEYDLHTRMILGGIKFYQFDVISFFYRIHNSKSRISNNQMKPEIVGNVISTRTRYLSACSDPALKLILAQNLWSYGRSLLTLNNSESALKAFEIALAASGRQAVYGSRIYRITEYFLGPVLTQKLVVLFRKATKKETISCPGQ